MVKGIERAIKVRNAPRGERAELMAKINKMNPTFCELLPLTLEEIFINETEVAGYDVKKLLF